ncbi:glyoxalase [Chitinophaga sp. Mgbs1]|uniref:Glyoxalase n=1 Tax=Chitinophaga solisilvae TaxID=1233460 RepID=A0A3S1JHV1_9BACT|nr:glyoxalase [Chitinophaga solisilvae]
MVIPEFVIGVKDVRASAAWYQQLLRCEAAHGGDTFEILKDEKGTVILCLHKWGPHGHPTLTDPAITPGNGLIVFLRVSNFRQIWKNAQGISQLQVAEVPHMNHNSGREEFSLRDPDGYYVSISAAE